MADVDEVPGHVGIKQCQPCLRNNKTNEAYKYCEDCGEYQCQECEKIHQLFPVTAKHKLVNIEEARTLTSMYDMKGLDRCKEHHKLLKFFCEDENEPCCGACAIVSHRKCHHVVEIEKTKKLENLDLPKIQRDLRSIEDRANKIMSHLQTTKARFTMDAFKITDQIQTMQDKINKMFENLKQTVSKEIASFQKQTFDDIDTKTAVCNSCIADLKQTVTDIQAVSEQGSPVQQLIMANHFKDRGTEFKTQTENMFVELKDLVVTFDFDLSLKLPPANDAMPGKITVNFIRAAEISSGVTVSPQKVMRVNLKLLASIDLKQGEGDVKVPLLLGLDFLSDGRLVTVDNKNKRCVVFNQNLESLNSFALAKFPQGLAVVSHDIVAITTTDGHKLIFLKITKQNEINFVRECNVKKKFQSISVIDNDSMLVGCNDDTQPVRVLSMKGEEEEVGIQFPTKIYSNGTSDCTYIKNRNKVVHSYRFAHKVCIFDKGTNTRVDVKDEKIITEPRGMAVGPADCIFVCSLMTRSVVQISHTGQILSSHVLDMNNPRSVCVSKDNTRLAVSNKAAGQRKLQLYNIELV